MLFVEYPVFYFYPPEFSVAQVLHLKIKNSGGIYSSNSNLHFASSYLLLTVSSNPFQCYFALVFCDSLGLSKCFMTTWIKNHQRTIWDSQGYLQSRPLIRNTMRMAHSQLLAQKHYYRSLIYWFILFFCGLFLV